MFPLQILFYGFMLVFDKHNTELFSWNHIQDFICSTVNKARTKRLFWNVVQIYNFVFKINWIKDNFSQNHWKCLFGEHGNCICYYRNMSVCEFVQEWEQTQLLPVSSVRHYSSLETDEWLCLFQLCPSGSSQCTTQTPTQRHTLCSYVASHYAACLSVTMRNESLSKLA